MAGETVRGNGHGLGDDAELPTGIVVGVDGSEHGRCALIWAAREAQRRHRPLHVVTAYSVPIFAASGLDGGYSTIDDAVIQDGARAVLKEALDSVEGFDDVEITSSVESGDAAGVLLQFSEAAELLVFGTRGRGGFVGRLLGSVSSALPAHAKCTTVTVPLRFAERLGEKVEDRRLRDERAQEPPREPEHIVAVGVDGSEQARVAVLVAAEEAMLLGVPLRVICAVPQFSGSLAWAPAPVDRDQLFRDIQAQLKAGTAWLQSHFPDLEVQTSLVDGAPVDVLVDASRAVDLLVLGTRGHGGFAGMLLGSTTDGVLHHAKGPVMVVPDHEDERLADRPKFGPMLAP
ncbi:universal stress protein [Sinomonas sp. JGH33]|uniref:Universal stress protein n=1 Tax=Sinomonas terricola TaxID=3110330 RepID=A0ABU5T5G2_9MICC|nr:universal stress protein [Sinomonas sp. JGH33]MEA5454908.1 universal stress protein [Sinomonas sp. JGH33]